MPTRKSDLTATQNLKAVKDEPAKVQRPSDDYVAAHMNYQASLYPVVLKSMEA